MPEVLLQVSYRNSKRLKDIFRIAELSGFDGIELDSTGIDHDIDNLYLLSIDHNMPIRNIIAPRITADRPFYYFLNGDFKLHALLNTFIPRIIIFNVPKSPFIRGLPLLLFRNRVLYFKEKYGNDIISIENNAPSRLSFFKPVMGIKGIRDFAYQHDIFINFDSSNCAASGRDILQAYDMLAPRVKNVHLGDYVSGRGHLIPGTGKLPLGMLMTKMKDFRYTGTITLELNPAETIGNNDGDTIALYRELIGYIRSYF